MIPSWHSVFSNFRNSEERMELEVSSGEELRKAPLFLPVHFESLRLKIIRNNQPFPCGRTLGAFVSSAPTSPAAVEQTNTCL